MEKLNLISKCCNDPTGATAEQVGTMMEKSQHEAIVMTRSEFVEYLQDKAGERREVLEAVKTYIHQSSLRAFWTDTLGKNVSEPAVVPAGQLGADAYIISKVLYLVGLKARYRIEGPYIILMGRPGLRRALNTPRYLASNPKVIQMGFGLKGLQNTARGGFILSFVISAGIETLDCIFNERTMVDLVGGIGVEAVKCGIAAFAGYVAGAAVLSITGVAALPLIGMAVVSFFAAEKLNELDNRYNIKKQVITALKTLPDNLEKGLYIVRSAIETDWKVELEREIRQFEDWLIRAAEQQVEAFLQRAVMNLFRHRLFRIGLS